jgi:hypothetical protein
MNPPHGPIARRANPYPPPAVGIVDDNSARANTIAVYIVAMSTVAMSNPPHPPAPSPKCQPAKSPDMT